MFSPSVQTVTKPTNTKPDGYTIFNKFSLSFNLLKSTFQTPYIFYSHLHILLGWLDKLRRSGVQVCHYQTPDLINYDLRTPSLENKSVNFKYRNDYYVRLLLQISIKMMVFEITSKSMKSNCCQNVRVKF